MRSIFILAATAGSSVFAIPAPAPAPKPVAEPEPQFGWGPSWGLGSSVVPLVVGGAILGSIAKGATTPSQPAPPRVSNTPWVPASYPQSGYPPAAGPPGVRPGTPYCISPSPNAPLVCYNQPVGSQPQQRPPGPALEGPQQPWVPRTGPSGPSGPSGPLLEGPQQPWVPRTGQSGPSGPLIDGPQPWVPRAGPSGPLPEESQQPWAPSPESLGPPQNEWFTSETRPKESGVKEPTESTPDKA